MLHSKVHSGEQFTEQDMENNLDGHICRCTGYRSLLDAAKSFASGDIEVCFHFYVYFLLFEQKLFTK